MADFLRVRREALKPEDVGLQGGGRRRTPGLRREEVSTLAGVGTTWYTWLEQAREVRASLDVLEALADALQLTDAERAHLVLLGRGGRPAAPAPDEHVPPPIRRLIENLLWSPACILGRRSDFLAWNGAFAGLFGDPADLPDGRRNQMWAVFNEPSRRELMKDERDWEIAARNAVARFRADSAAHVGDECFDELIAELRRESSEFRRLWKRHEVRGHATGRKDLVHPDLGDMSFEHAVFRLEDAPEQRMILYTPLPEHDTASKMEQLTGRASSVR